MEARQILSSGRGGASSLCSLPLLPLLALLPARGPAPSAPYSPRIYGSGSSTAHSGAEARRGGRGGGAEQQRTEAEAVGRSSGAWRGRRAPRHVAVIAFSWTSPVNGGSSDEREDSGHIPVPRCSTFIR